MENWKDIDGTNGLYQVSDEGRVRKVTAKCCSRTQKRWGAYRYLKPVRHKGHGTDYLDIQLGGTRRELIHRLVAKAFIPNPDKLPQVNHLNGVGTDNRVSNLEWCTNRQNTLHAKANGWTRPGKEARPIRCIDTGMEFGSSFEAADYVNQIKYHDSHRIKSLACNIRACAYGKRPTAYGFRWEQFQ